MSNSEMSLDRLSCISALLPEMLVADQK